jgi:hypothetical protein
MRGEADKPSHDDIPPSGLLEPRRSIGLLLDREGLPLQYETRGIARRLSGKGSTAAAIYVHSRMPLRDNP